MIQDTTLGFLRQLKANNDKTWFDAHRKQYEAAKQDFEDFIVKLLPAFADVEPAVVGQQPKNCIYRIYRDVRFSKDKTPYKPHFSAFFARGGRKWDGAGYYLHLEPGAIFAGGGLWMPEASLLKKVRQEIDYGFPAFEKIVGSKAFAAMFGKLNGEALSRPPQGYDAANPAIEFLKMKSFTAGHRLQDEQLTSPQALNEVMQVFRTLQPLVQFLNRAQDD
jgi:uncharacterized protein (TIGR02453 family)